MPPASAARTLWRELPAPSTHTPLGINHLGIAALAAVSRRVHRS